MGAREGEGGLEVVSDGDLGREILRAPSPTSALAFVESTTLQLHDITMRSVNLQHQRHEDRNKVITFMNNL